MSNYNDSGNYFQTSDSLATIERKAGKAKNKHGDPIRLPSKILAVHQADDKTAVFVAEAAGEIKRVILETSQVKKLSTQATAPLTSIAVCTKSQRIFSGCWDKHIYSTAFDTGRAPTSRLSGHTDFVKCLLATSLNGKPFLLSGGADAVIIVWDVESGKPIHKLTGHTKALQDLALDPFSLPEDSPEPDGSFTLFSASSDREIRRWHISRNSAYELPDSIENPILAHETSVYKIRFDADGDLWTASADKTAKHLVRSRDWEADTVLEHPDFVRDAVVAEPLGLVVTACRDEEVRVWDAASGDVVCMYSGHYEEVTGLVLMGSKVVSVSIDGTVRQWSLERRDMTQYLEDIKKESNGEVMNEVVAKGSSALTAEEEAELAELMDADDDEDHDDDDD